MHCCLYFLLHLTYLPSSTPVGHVAMTTLLHRVLTFASPHESPISFSCTITVFRHVVFGRPGSLLLGRVHLRATLGICLYAFSSTAAAYRLVEFHIIFFIGPEYPADLSQTSIVEGVDLCHVHLNHKSALSAIP